MSYLQNQQAWLDKTRLKPGDYIIVKRVADSYENGWATVWTYAMNALTNKKFKIKGIDDEYGISLLDGWGHLYYVPYFVCAPKKLKIG